MNRAKLSVGLSLVISIALAGCSAGGGNGRPAPLLTSLAVNPTTASIPFGLTQQFTAMGRFTDGTSQDITSMVSWSSLAPNVATISGSGLATSRAQGSATIMASSGSVSGSATLGISAPALVSITVTPPSPSVPAGLSQQLTAAGTFSDGSVQDLTSAVTWSSSAPVVATVSAGLVSTKAAGLATITAASGTISGSTHLTVTSPVVLSVAVTPASASIAASTAQQFTATGTFSDGSTQDITQTVIWSSAPTTIAAVNPGGLATGLAPGSATITATFGSLSASADLTVTNATLTSVSVTPATVSIARGTTQQFSAIGAFNDGTTQDITVSISWSCSSPTVASVSSTGLATGLQPGTVAIAARMGSVSASAALTVTKASLLAIAVLPANRAIAMTTRQQLAAVGSFADGSTQVLTSLTWGSSATAVATITPSGGLAAGVSPGTATITAASGGISGSTTLTVTNATLVSIAVTPANPTVNLGLTQGFRATVTFSDNTTQDLSNQVNWSSSNAGVATINNFGLASSVGSGGTTIVATFNSVSGFTSLSVTTITLVSISVAPANPSIAIGTSQQFFAIGTFSDGKTQNLSSQVTWNSSAPTVTKVSSGLATGVGVGSATISATLGSIVGSTTLTVTGATLVSIVITPVNPSIALDTLQTFTATGTFDDGTTQNLTRSVAWSSANGGVATISNSNPTAGQATGISAGTTTIIAILGTISSSTSLTVNSATLSSIAITPANPTITLGDTASFTATGNFSDGTTQNLTSQVAWSSSNASVAVISIQGLATSAGQGTTTISATLQGISGSTTLTVK